MTTSDGSHSTPYVPRAKASKEAARMLPMWVERPPDSGGTCLVFKGFDEF